MLVEHRSFFHSRHQRTPYSGCNRNEPITMIPARKVCSLGFRRFHYFLTRSPRRRKSFLVTTA